MVCTSFRGMVDTHEHVIASRILRHCGRNMELLSELFPSPKSRNPGHEGQRRPTLQYIHSLEKRDRTCSELAHHLSRRAVAPIYERHEKSLAAPMNLTRREKKEMEAHKERAIRGIQRKLAKQLYYVEQFLLNTRLHFSAALTSLAVEDAAGAPPTVDLLMEVYHGVQDGIIKAMPDNVLMSTHHAFHFLVNSIRLAMSPDPPHNMGDDTVLIMLRCASPLQRCNEFLAADVPSAPSKLRRQFMADMVGEKEQVEMLTNVVFGASDRKAGKRRGSGLAKDLGWELKIREIWFDVARNELRRRSLERHRADGLFLFPEVQGEVMVGCPGCVVPG
ncbi:hypothetical protein FN846DRAFT_932653 [Sphaerosporella brunnea]|uniref:Uncharacterized protein n=1 Tax=Sphaerosporella brunnea TaxID=1250544 RepID=A0A5J5F7N8_9PEZI|nr:hypothetical protein FN846DRAFT_932653 [Sphaerosporella brunnea]